MMDKDELKKHGTGNFRMVDVDQLNSLKNPRVNLTDAEFEKLLYVAKFVEENMQSYLQKRALIPELKSNW